jgi:kynurenine formamidase
MKIKDIAIRFNQHCMRKSLPYIFFSVSTYMISCSSPNNNKVRPPFEHIVDLTHILNNKFPFIPTPVTYPFELKPIATFDSMQVAANEWKIHEHIGTQFDAPSHFIKDGISAEQIEVKDLFVPAIVIDISAKAAINRDAVLTVADIINWEKDNGSIPDNAAVLMYSGWDKKISTPDFIGLDSFHKKHFPGISREAAEFLVTKRNIAGVGADVVSFDPGIDDTYQTHRIILGKGKWALECLANLQSIPVRGAFIFVGAPKVEGATGGLSRVIAVW